MPQMDPQEVIELWAETAFDAWVDEDSAVFERIQKEHPRFFELVKQGFKVGFAMGGGAALGPDHDELINALGDLG